VPALIGRSGRRCWPVSLETGTFRYAWTQDFGGWADTGQGASARIITGRAWTEPPHDPHRIGDPGSPSAVPGELSVDARIAVCAL